MTGVNRTSAKISDTAPTKNISRQVCCIRSTNRYIDSIVIRGSRTVSYGVATDTRIITIYYDDGIISSGTTTVFNVIPCNGSIG